MCMCVCVFVGIRTTYKGLCLIKSVFHNAISSRDDFFFCSPSSIYVWVLPWWWHIHSLIFPLKIPLFPVSLAVGIMLRYDIRFADRRESCVNLLSFHSSTSLYMPYSRQIFLWKYLLILLLFTLLHMERFCRNF